VTDHGIMPMTRNNELESLCLAEAAITDSTLESIGKGCGAKVRYYSSTLPGLLENERLQIPWLPSIFYNVMCTLCLILILFYSWGGLCTFIF